MKGTTAWVAPHKGGCYISLMSAIRCTADEICSL